MNKARNSRRLWLAALIALCPTTSCVTDEREEGQTHQYTNALIHATSPYLLQHAHNPVNWMEWGPAAFAKAKAENKPIFVSIGYSTCYWCHVMERESFEDEGVAKILNDNYVAIKVDREQRPDIDEQLMLATQLMTGRGGWPNSVWLTTDGRPWMSGTYFPRPQFKDALLQLATAWKAQPDAVEKQANALAEAIRKASTLEVPKTPITLDASPMTRALAELNQIFDEKHGGFGTKPKFPPHGILRLLARAVGEGNNSARRIMTRTLDAMWCGGIHDHVGGGFHRYSTDERWFLPHFEKMLYDNGQLMRAYSEAYALTENPIYRAAVEDIFKWLQREMTHPEGAFFSAIDSESEGGEEGRYYTWSIEELKQVLSSADAASFAKTYNLQDQGNFAEEATGDRPGTNIPFLELSRIAVSTDDRFSALRAKLNDARKTREYPHLDDKILTSWNGLMISALARASVVFEDQRYTQAAEKAAGFILAELQTDGQLLRTWREGRASLPGFLSDYAYFTEALVELHIATRNADWLTEAERLTQDMLELFEDEANGGFYFTSTEHEALLLRSKNLLGGGNLPNANGVATQVLLKLFAATNNPRYWIAAERTLMSFSTLMGNSPRQVEHLVLANTMYLEQKSQAGSDATLPSATISETYRDPDGVLTLRLMSPDSQVVAGQSCQLAIEIDITEGYHLYGPTPGKSLVQATRVAIGEATGFSSGDVAEPDGKLQQDKVLNQELRIYEGLIRFVVPITISQTTEPGPVDIIVSVAYQACDDRRCLLPKTAKLKRVLTVTGAKRGGE